MKEPKKRNKYLHKKVYPVDGSDKHLFLDNGTEETEELYNEPLSLKWYDELPKEKSVFPEIKESEVIALKKEAEMALKKEEDFYSKKGSRSGRSDRAWVRTVMAKGTASDRIAAHVVTIQDAPVYNLSALRSLVNMVKVSKKKECLMVMETLTELFHTDLLKPGRKLRLFDQQPLSLLGELSSGNALTRKKYLCYWLFEDQLKALYTQFVAALDAVGKDTVDVHRERAVTAMYQLLSRHPEQEAVLLKNLVNKLGDPNQKVVSKVIYSLTQLLRVHPVMKQVVANEIEKFLFRPNIGTRSQYYAICFLSQYLYEREEAELAENMISIYFSFFKANIKKGDIDSRMMGALLMGVNRAYPYAKMERSELSEHVDTLYRLVHVCGFNISLHTLCLLYQIVGKSTENDRFYCALYKKLLDPHLASSAHQAMFVNLVYKALNKDQNIARVRVFVKRLLQVSLNGPSQLASALLYLVSQLISKRAQLLSVKTFKHRLYTEDDTTLEDDEEHYADAPLPEPLEEQEKNTRLSVEEEESEKISDSKNDLKMEPEEKPKPGWFHCKNNKTKVRNESFDWRARNPAHAGGEHAAYEELTSLVAHFHPTVALFARNILDKQQVKYSGDPLQDFTLVRFLERFVFKNPKQVSGGVGGDGGPKGPDPCLAPRRHYKAVGAKSMPVNSAAFRHQEEQTVPVDELFLYRYLQKRQPAISDVKEEDDSDVESVCSEEFNDMLDNMVGKVDEELDFADDIGDKLKSRNKSKQTKEESESESEEDFSEEEVKNEDDDLTDLEDEDDEEAIDFGEDVEDFDGELDLDELDEVDDDDDDAIDSDENISKPKGKVKNKHGGKGGMHSLFAPAEKFSEMLEEAGASKFKVGTAQDVSNKDNAAVKQLEWESKRNHWVHGKKRKQFGKAGGKPFNKNKRRKH